MPVSLPALVCKQYWTEASTVFFSAAVFKFVSPFIFRGFVTSPRIQTVVPHIEQLFIASILDPTYFASTWGQVLDSANISRFLSLRGLNWRILFFSSEESLVQGPALLDSPSWAPYNMLSIIQAFQQHKLRRSLTSVNFKSVSPSCRTDTTALSEKVLELLLKHR